MSTQALAATASYAEDTIASEVLGRFAKAIGERTPTAAMRRVCGELREAFGEIEPPTGLHRLLGQMRVRVIPRRIRSDGLLELNRDGYRIGVNPARPWRRQRFTVAHELGHILILNALAGDREALQALSAPALHGPVERLCDQAAAELLMPPEAVIAELEAEGLTTDGLQRLYDRFLVSWSVLYWRLVELHPGTGVSLWTRTDDERTGGTTFRISRTFAHYPEPTWLPRRLSVRYLEPDPVGYAYLHGRCTATVSVKIRGRESLLNGVATTIPTRRQPSQLPLYKDHLVADEPAHPAQVALVLSPNVVPASLLPPELRPVQHNLHQLQLPLYLAKTRMHRSIGNGAT